MVNLNTKISSYNVACGVPQGFILVLLFSIHISHLFKLFANKISLFNFHADDTQIYLVFDPSDHNRFMSRDIKAYMSDNFLLLISNKTEVFFGSKAHRDPIIRILNSSVLHP